MSLAAHTVDLYVNDVNLFVPDIINKECINLREENETLKLLLM